jgi:hypothetical protein
MTDFEARVLGDLNVLKCQMEQVMGIGQPGRLHHLEDRVAESEQSVQKIKGAFAAFATGLTILHLAITYFGSRHK